jgi:pyruvate dehydrogenase E2 component (dihydrolipoamide acetyltransferase)
MATALKMPQLGVTMTEAKILRWLKQEGEPVAKGEPVAEIETDKLNTEVGASADGVLRRIVAQEGETIPVVGLIGVIAGADEDEAAIDAVADPHPPAPSPNTREQVPGEGEQSRGTGSVVPLPRGGLPSPSLGEPGTRAAGGGVRVVSDADVRASPIAKRLARDLGVDLSLVQGTGPQGRVVEADVRTAATAVAAPSPTPAAPQDGFVRASPLARRLAREQGLDLHALGGTGPDGRVVERDILTAVEAQSRAAQTVREAAPAIVAAPVPAGLTPRETIAFDGMRRVIAERMYQSLRQSAQLTLTTEADATQLVDLRQHLVPAARVYGHRPPTYTDLIVLLVARTLRDHPLLNSSLVAAGDAQQVVCWQEINVGVAVALERGLVVPVIRDAGRKALQDVSQELGDLAERARANRLTMDDLQGGTFTITNLGQQEVDAFTPIINPPQSAILGVGRIAKKPAVVGDAVVARHMVTLSLTFDHRVVDGAPAGLFLRDVKRAIEAGEIGGTAG